MMKIRLAIICLLTTLAFIYSTSLLSAEDSNYKSGIKSALADYEKAWNDKDADGVIAIYHDDAQIMTGREKKIVTKEKYKSIIPDRRSRFGKIRFGETKIDLKDNKAKVNVPAEFKKIKVDYTFYMVQKDDKWLIMVQEY